MSSSLAGAHGRMTTGQANWATDATKVWFVMIKDRKGRYPNSPLWGDGWGWALFKNDAPNKQCPGRFPQLADPSR